MEIFTLDILAAVVSSLKYANPTKLESLNKIIVTSHLIAEEMDERVSYQTFVAALLKEMGGIGIIEEEDLDRKSRPYQACEIIRTMPEIVPFQYKIADIVLENRERADGNGYPAGKEKISMEARIIGLSEDFVDLKSIEELRNSKKHNEEYISILEKLLKDNNFVDRTENNEKRDEYLGVLFNKYNVYKNDLDNVESEQFLMTIAAFIDAKHKYTAGHSKRVASYSYVIAKNMGYEGEKLTEIRYASYLHDIGKLATKIDLLDKPNKLTDVEYEEIKNHALYSYEILNSSQHLKRFSYGALHHERIDGKGYPFGLKGDQIHEGAKIIAVADILDALTSNRPYRKPFTFKEAFELMEMMAGTTLDKDIFEMAKNSFLMGYTEEE